MILASSACADLDTCEDGAVTNPIPNRPDPAWGFGKLDVAAAVGLALQRRAGSFPTADPGDGKFITVAGQAKGC